VALKQWSQVRAMVWQVELGESQTPHIQAAIQFVRPVMFGTLQNKLSGKAHIEKMWGSWAQSVHYCSKPCRLGTNEAWHIPADGRRCDCDHCRGAQRLEGPWAEGQAVEQGDRSDLQLFFDAVKVRTSLVTLIEEHTETIARYPKFRMTIIQGLSYEEKLRMYMAGDKQLVTVIYGSAGRGKTRYVYEKHDARDIHRVSMGDGSNKSLWFDGYEMQPVLLIDDFREGAIRLEKLLRLLDRYPEPCQVKGDIVYPSYKFIYITTGNHPKFWYGKVMQIHPENRAMLMRRFDEILNIDAIRPEVSSGTEPAVGAPATLSPITFEDDDDCHPGYL